MIRNWLRAFVRGEQAQDAFEYVLIIGVVVVAVLVAIATPVGSTMIDAVLDGVCGAIDAMPGISIVIANCTA
jgi:Flp pilus assembly pilin Flp